MSADKYLRIFLCQMEATGIVYITTYNCKFHCCGKDKDKEVCFERFWPPVEKSYSLA